MAGSRRPPGRRSKRAPATPNGVFGFKTKRGGTGRNKGLQTQLEGFDLYEANMQRLFAAISGRDLDAATEDATTVIEERMADLAPRDRGRLAKGIRRRREKSTPTFSEWVTGPWWKTFWGLFQELGTIYHPAQPFMRPALDEGKVPAQQAFAARLGRRIGLALRG